METTQPFTVDRHTVFKSMMLTPSTGWLLWILLSVGLSLTAFGCRGDFRFLILGLVISLTVFPAVAIYLFVNYMFSTERLANLLHHTLERHESGYLLRIFRHADQDDPMEEGKTWIETGRIILYDSNIVGKKSITEYDVIHFKDSPLEILYVPKNLK